jgi:hypothetical protein
MRPIAIILFAVILGLTACNHARQRTNTSLTNTIYKLGRKTDSTSTGPFNNSAFVLKISDTLPPLLLTAHHVVADNGNDQYLKWNEIAEKKGNLWAWSMNDSTYNFKIGPNLPIRGAETLKLDLAAFYLQQDSVPYLKPSRKAAHVGDTVYLYSKVRYNNKTSLKNRGVVIYATDSVFVYGLTDFNGNVGGVLSGTSGSCVLDRENNVVANSYGGLAIPNEEIKKQMAIGFPLINKLNTRDGKTYGIGLPISLIKESIVQAFKDKN